MTLGRAITLIVAFLIPAALWGALHQAKNDVPALTRSLVRQIRTVGETRSLDDGRAARAWVTFYGRFRYPEGSPHEQEMLFEDLWRVLRRCDPERVTAGREDRVELQPGRPLPRRRVTALGRDRDGEPVAVELEWVQYRGNWYINSFRQRPG